MTQGLIIAAGLLVVCGLVWFFERRHSRIWNAAIASVTWHEKAGEWSVIYDGVTWYVETEDGELGKARAMPFGHQAGLNFTLKLHHLIELVRDRDVKKQWRARHGVVLEQDKSP